ncbi:MAG: FAD-dependent oxidoreductase [Chloroflexota bacterium]
MLKRTLSRLKHRPFDLLVIGGTHLGSLIAWDASLRGLRVALLATADFGSGNDPIGLSLIQGGMRFLKGDSFAQARQMVKERQAFLHIAPHLVRPLPQLLISEKQGFQFAFPAMATAVKANHLFNIKHNFGLDPSQFIDHGRPLTRRQVCKRNPWLKAKQQISAGLCWEEAQVLDSQRLQLSFLKSAVAAGAVAANYIRVEGLRTFRSQVIGVEAVDELSGEAFDIGARMVVDASDGAVDKYLSQEISLEPMPDISLVLLTRQLIAGQAFHVIKSDREEEKVVNRLSALSIVPWGDYSLVGPFKTQELIEWSTQKLLKYVNETLPSANLKGHDIYQILPQIISSDSHYQSEPLLFSQTKLIDFSANGGLHGFISARNPDFETSRYLAERTIDTVVAKLQRPAGQCRTTQNRAAGGQIVHWDTFELAVMEKWPIEMPPYQIRRYLQKYGSQYRDIFPILQETNINCQPISDDTAVTRAEVIFAIRHEMARKLTDIVMRRTDLGLSLDPSVSTLEKTAQIFADEHDWSKERLDQELDEALTSMSTLRF